MTETTTCQICGRAIKAPIGYPQADRHLSEIMDRRTIAHHGYQRPGQGWQTASCFGARWRPYEVACDALPPAIDSCRKWLEGVEAAYADWRENPPAELTTQRKKHGYPVGDQIKHARPDGFDPTIEGSWTPNTYEAEFRSTQGMRKREISSARMSLKEMEKRLADWRDPAEKVAC